MRLMKLAAMAAASLLLGGTAVRAEVTLDVLYCFPAFAQFHEPIAKEFMKLHPDIKINFRAPASSYDEGHQAMLRASITNQLPDVYYAGYAVVEPLVHTLEKRGQIVDLGPLLAAEPADWRKANYSDNILSLAQVDGKQWGMAFNASLPIMTFNTELVKQAGGDPAHMPDTWDGVIALAAKIKALGNGDAGIAYNIHDWPDEWLWRSIIMQGGGDAVDPSGKVTFGGASGLKALTDLRRLVTEGGMPLIDWDQSRQQFIAGKIGMFFDTPARLRQVTDLIGSKFTLGSAIFPVDDKANGKLPTGGNAVVITTKDPAKQKAAWEFVKFVTGPLAQSIVVRTTGYMPTNLLAGGPDFLGSYYDKNPNFKTVSLQTNRSAPWIGYPGGNTVRIWRAQRDIINAEMHGDISPKDALDKLISTTTTLMK